MRKASSDSAGSGEALREIGLLSWLEVEYLYEQASQSPDPLVHFRSVQGSNKAVINFAGIVNVGDRHEIRPRYSSISLDDLTTCQSSSSG